MSTHGLSCWRYLKACGVPLPASRDPDGLPRRRAIRNCALFSLLLAGFMVAFQTKGLGEGPASASNASPGKPDVPPALRRLGVVVGPDPCNNDSPPQLAIDADCSQINDRDMQLLAGFPSARVVYLNNTSISDDGLSVLRKLKQLRILDLNHTQVTDSGMKYVAELKELKYLNLNGQGTHIGDGGLREITKLGGLVRLRLGNSRVSDAGVAALIPSGRRANGVRPSFNTLAIAGKPQGC